jgi:hypothetical protein
MERRTWFMVAAVVVILLLVGYAAGWFGGGAEAPPAATTPAPGQAEPRSRRARSTNGWLPNRSVLTRRRSSGCCAT